MSAVELAPGPEIEALEAEQLVAALVERFGPSLTLACSFQKEETVLLDMLLRAEPSAHIFALDTHVLFPETYSLWREIEARYGVAIEVFDGPTLAEQAAEHGEALWETAPDRCCGIRKVEPLGRALEGRQAWITGVRREQSPTRAGAPKLGWDDAHGLWKASPLADWTERDVWDYISAHDLPYNPLHDAGYASIGCTHCTRPGAGRDGRWADQAKTECGLHPGAVS